MIPSTIKIRMRTIGEYLIRVEPSGSIGVRDGSQPAPVIEAKAGAEPFEERHAMLKRCSPPFPDCSPRDDGSTGRQG